MSEAPPAWFLECVTELERLGFPALDEYRRDDLWGSWCERWNARRPAEGGNALARVISLYPGCVWTCESMRATRGGACFAAWLAELAAISGGALVVGDVEETWATETAVTVRFAANGGWFELVPTQTRGSVLTRELLDAASAAADRAAFRELIVERGAPDEEVDDDAMTIVCVPRDAARELSARGVRFVEWAPAAPAPRGRIAQWFERLGVGRPPPAPAAPVTAIRRLGDRETTREPAKRREDGPPLSAVLTRATADLRRITEALEPHARPSWRPVTKPGASREHASQFGGVPWLDAGEPAPRCENCEQAMSLAVQLDLATVPPPLRATGLLQCFVCLDDHEAHARITGSGRRAEAQTAAPLPARRIVGWTERPRELPGPAQWDSLGLAFDALATTLAEEELDEPDGDDKLGGWPALIQSDDLGDCARCGKPRALLLQIASGGALAVHFGDGGRLFIAACPDHPDLVAAHIECH